MKTIQTAHPQRVHCVNCTSKDAVAQSLHPDFSWTSEGLALEHHSTILLICIMFSCALSNLQLDCFNYLFVLLFYFFLRNYIMRSHGFN